MENDLPLSAVERRQSVSQTQRAAASRTRVIAFKSQDGLTASVVAAGWDFFGVARDMEWLLSH